MPARYYHFKGKNEDIINSILSLLVGKEYYQESSYYSNFLNDSQSARYRKKLIAILDLMQKENFILIREDEDGLETTPFIAVDNKISKADSLPSPSSRVYLRQHGKQVLSEGGYKRIPRIKNMTEDHSVSHIPLNTNLALLILLAAGFLCQI